MESTTAENLPKLTVIVAVRNAVSSVGRALDSLAAQHYPNLEVIVHDALSDDGTLDVLKHYPDLITVLKSERDNGPPDAYNRAVSISTGDYVGFLNADDELEPGALWAVADGIRKNPSCEVVSFGMLYRVHDSKGRAIVKGYYADERQLALKLPVILSEMQTFMVSRFIKRSLYKEIGLYNIDRNLWYFSNDREWMARLAIRGCDNVIIPKALYGFFVHKKSLSNNLENYVRIIEEHMLIAKSLLARSDINESQSITIRNWQKRHLAFGFWHALQSIRIDKAEEFAKAGWDLGRWRFALLCLYLLIAKLLKRIVLKLSGAIDRGVIVK